MKRIQSALPPDVKGTVVTVGTFDGVHLGHLDVIAKVRDRAQKLNLRSLLVTFDPHPLEVVNPAAAPLLLTVGSEKLEVLAESGLDYAAVLPFTHILAAYSAEAFVELILRSQFRMKELLIGHDHGFGRHRAGNVAVLQELGRRDGFRVEVIGAVSAPDGLAVSSTSIRRAIAGGDLDRAAAGLGRNYSVHGTIVKGSGRGKRIGFATINLSAPPARKLLPPEGVYAVRAQTPRGEFGGMMNLGPRPTFGESGKTLEAHLFDTSQDLYDSYVRLDFVQYLRETKRFSGAGELSAQLQKDEIAARRALTTTR
jgi:riboflavin kinase/FMN adenylyltransferase